jgi:hypothetical protein
MLSSSRGHILRPVVVLIGFQQRLAVEFPAALVPSVIPASCMQARRQRRDSRRVESYPWFGFDNESNAVFVCSARTQRHTRGGRSDQYLATDPSDRISSSSSSPFLPNAFLPRSNSNLLVMKYNSTLNNPESPKMHAPAMFAPALMR